MISIRRNFLQHTSLYQDSKVQLQQITSGSNLSFFFFSLTAINLNLFLACFNTADLQLDCRFQGPCERLVCKFGSKRAVCREKSFCLLSCANGSLLARSFSRLDEPSQAGWRGAVEVSAWPCVEAESYQKNLRASFNVRDKGGLCCPPLQRCLVN